MGRAESEAPEDDVQWWSKTAAVVVCLNFLGGKLKVFEFSGVGEAEV